MNTQLKMQIKKVLKQKGYPKGKFSKGKVLHHILVVTEGEKTISNNCQMTCKDDNCTKSGT